MSALSPGSLHPSVYRQEKHFSWVALLLVGMLLVSDRGGWAEKEKEKSDKEVEAVADQLEYTHNQKKIIAKGNVVITYGEVKLTSDYAEVETEEKKAYAKGHVIVLRGNQIAARGNEVYYDYKLDQGRFPDGRSIEFPWFTRGKEVAQTAKGKLKLTDAEITTCDLERPHYQVKAKSATVITGDKIIARNITIYVLGKKVFWWPYAVIPLQKPIESPIQIQPGYSSDDGAYILTTKGFSIIKSVWGKWHADYRFKRGFGAGVDLDYNFERIRTQGSVKTYLTQDKRAPTPGLANPYSLREDRVRGRVTWRQRTDFNEDTYALLRFHRLADEFFLQDFFEREFRSDVEPSSFVNFTLNSDRHGFYAYNQARINQFETTVERLPDIRFDWKNQRFFSDRLYYESATGLANLNQKFSREPFDLQNFRADSFHEWTFPMKWNEIKLTPSANFRETLYARDADESNARARTAFGAAVDLRTHFYRLLNVNSDSLGIEINQLRHVFEPSVRYDGIMHSTVSNEELTKFDSIDAVDDSDRITFGLENRIQTKRVIGGRMRRVDLVSLNTFLAYDFHPDEEFSTSGFSIWSTELQFRPYEWLQFEIRFDYDMMRNKFRELNQDLMARKGRFHVLLSHRLVTKHDFIGALGDNQFVFDTGYWINERWELGAHVRWDAVDHKLEEWQIAATRDLHDFLLDLGYNVRNSDISSSNKEIFFLFRLKAFPGYPLKAGNRASFSEPRIGSTVAGSNTIRSAAYLPTES